MDHTIKTWVAPLAAALALCGLTACDNAEPGLSDIQPLYRAPVADQPTSGERGSVMITEVGWAGSVSDEGVHDADDVFIEIQNKNPRPINLSNWHVFVGGDVEAVHRLPDDLEPIQPNDFFVIAAKADGAFGPAADLVLEDLEMGTELVYLELRDADLRLGESVGEHGRYMDQAGAMYEPIFAGGYDTVTARSMERVQLIFSNDGGSARSWHHFSESVGLDTVAEGWRKYTLASPGQANSADYSGSVSSGNFE